MRDCQCTGPGWCERHHVKKSPHLVRLCQTQDRYWQAWEEGRGPGQLPHVGQSVGSEKVHGGPGTELKKLLAKFHITDQGGCGCAAHAATMDLWGADRCEENIERIVGWMRSAAKKRRLPFSATAARVLVRRAIRNARQDFSELAIPIVRAS